LVKALCKREANKYLIICKKFKKYLEVVKGTATFALRKQKLSEKVEKRSGRKGLQKVQL
jgi:hypothetical protein